MDTLPVTDRTRVRRKPERQITDRAELNAALDAALVAHVAFVRDGRPVVIPMGFGRRGDELLLHGSTGAGLLLDAAKGLEVSVCITHLDGLVFARSTFDSSTNYRSVVVHGTATVVPDDDKTAALQAISDHLMPGRWDEVRPISRRELAATAVLTVSLAEASLKVRAQGASEDSNDGEHRSVWAGVLPLAVVAGVPQPSAGTPADLAVPRSVRAAQQRRTDTATARGRP